MRRSSVVGAVILAVVVGPAVLATRPVAAAPQAPPSKTPSPPGESSTPEKPGKPGKSGKPASRLSPQQEETVMGFLREHHAELAELLVTLRSSRPKDYQRAIRDLSKACERLSKIEEEDDEQYELELESWVVQSRIQLVIARLAMNANDELRAELRKLLDEQLDVKLRMLQIDRDRQADRLAKVEQNLRELSASRHALVEKQFQSLTKSSKQLGTRVKTAQRSETGDPPTAER